MDQKETQLTGGQMTSVTRMADKVYRTTGPWTPAVHQLLKHLEAEKFEGAPRVLGIDKKGREILTFMEGEAGYFSAERVVPANLWSDRVLVEAAKLLRRYHDATSSFVVKPDTKWQQSHPDPTKHEVICHNDFAPYNCIFANGHLKAIIDFDTAGPGPRIYDIAYAVYSFAPLFSDEKCLRVGLSAPPDRWQKIEIFCDAYGSEYCNGIIDAIIERLQDVHQMILSKAPHDARFQRKIDEGHVKGYEADIACIRHLKENS